jgi:hypothetical protein
MAGLTTFRVKLLKPVTGDTVASLLTLTHQYEARLRDKGINCCLRLQQHA